MYNAIASSAPRFNQDLIMYRQGILTNVLNPKVALFFLALLPQFVAPTTSYPMFSFFLGCLFITTGTLWCLFVALVAAKASTIVRSQTYLLNIVNEKNWSNFYWFSN